ncbi:MAG: TonB-dependent receptor [Gammaproteobacteria bacterium]|nr:TonB-dependent receptor [Gammaproteobacteria bacterium]
MQLRSDNSNERLRLPGTSIRLILVAFGLVVATGTLATQDEEASDKDDAQQDEGVVEESKDAADSEEDEVATEITDADQEMGEIVTTGTRLPTGDSTALVHSYSEEDIAMTGASTLDEFLRTVPWQFNSTNPQTSSVVETGDELRGDSGYIWDAFDLATANLQGLGSSNTLVLLNGRRVAGYGGSERDIVNLLGIPMHAIERVDIQLDGGSAVYGADAIAGVINFITKKNYRGLNIDLRQEMSSTGSDNLTGSATFGMGWRGGTGTLTVSKDEQEPIINSKIGWTSRDYRELMGPAFDYRNFNVGQPGIVAHWNGSSVRPGAYYNNYYIDGTRDSDPEKLYTYQLPADHSGVGATKEDFRKGDRYSTDHIEPHDVIAHENGAHSGREAVVLNLQHAPFSSVKLFLDALHSEGYSYRKQRTPSMTVVVPATNAYNPFGEPMYVNYVPVLEQSNGLLPVPFSEIINRNTSATIGGEWTFMERNTLEVELTESRSTTNSISFGVPRARERHSPGTDEYYRRLSSSDPEVAFNFFGNGSKQGEDFEHFLGETTRRIGFNKTTTGRVTVKGFLWNFRGDEISYVAGASRTARRYQTRYLANLGLSKYEFDYNLVWTGTLEPVYRNETIFWEFWIPLMSEEHAGWWGRSLHLTLKNMRTIDSTWGSIGRAYTSDYRNVETEVWSPAVLDWVQELGISLSYVPIEGAELVQYKQADNAPNIGVVYLPTEDVRISINMSRNIQQPLVSQLYDTRVPFRWRTYNVEDIFDPDGPTTHSVIPYTYYRANPNLVASVSENQSARVLWTPNFLDGLEVQVAWINTSFEGRILHTRDFRDEPQALHPDNPLGVRDERGDLISLNYDYFNAEIRKHRSLDVHIAYAFSTPLIGRFEAKLHHNRILENYDEPFKGLVYDKVGTITTPDRYRTTLQLFWDRNKLSASMIARYTPGYLNDRAHFCSFSQKRYDVGRCAQFDPYNSPGAHLEIPVASLTVVDATATYQFDERLELRFGALNLFDRGAPLTIRNGIPYDASRWNARGQVLSLGLRYSM